MLAALPFIFPPLTQPITHTPIEYIELRPSVLLAIAKRPDFPDRRHIVAAQQKEAAERLEAARRAEAARQAQLTTQAANVRPAASPAVRGTCDAWIAAAGILDVVNARELIRRESGCNPLAVNPTSGACGVAQELPCGKSGCAWGDGACQVAWMNRYVLQRYGSWANAVAFHNANNWY